MATGRQGKVEAYAQRLWEAEQERAPMSPLTVADADLQPEDAYQIQLVNVRRRMDAGEMVVGHKVGLTSKPMQNMLGVHEPDFGHLFAAMQFRSGDTIDYPLLQPKVEPELAFILKEDLTGTNVTVHDVIQATAYVVPAIEIIDSRIADWKIQLVDTIADNASCGCFALGDQATSIGSAHIGTVGGVMRINGQVVETGAGAAVLGHPAQSVAWLVNKLSSLGTTVKKGEVVLAGAVSAAVSVRPGDRVSVSFGQLGRVDITFPM